MKPVLRENSLPCVLSSAAFATPEIYNLLHRYSEEEKVDNNLILDDEATLECPGP